MTAPPELWTRVIVIQWAELVFPAALLDSGDLRLT